MKADIPDSIIISRDDEGVLHHSYWTTDQQLIPFEETKFIRKDALLEWLEQNRNQSQMWFDRYKDKEDLSAKQVWEEVIDKLNSM